VTEQAWLPQGVDAHRPTDARVHDYALGGKDNYAIDRTYYQAVLSANGSAAAIRGDATRPGEILGDPVVAEMIDFDRPVGLLMTYMLQLVPEDPARIVREFGAPLAAGSHLVLSHPTLETLSPAEREAVHAVFEELREPVRTRGRAEVTALFDGFELLDPGLVYAPEWRPDRPYREPTGWVLAGVGRKP
jgi:hypothetical protein